MPVTAGSFSTARARGNREDLQDFIALISPMDTPALSLAGTAKADAVLHEWQIDALMPANKANAKLEGDSADSVNRPATQRLTNTCQIMDKTFGVSGTQEVVAKAGRDSELSYQEMKAGKELKTDMEAILFGEQGQNVGVYDGNGVNTTARRARAFESWISSNASRGATGAAAASATVAPTDGTARALTETLLQTVVTSMRNNGAKVGGCTVVFPVPARTVASSFVGRTNSRQQIDASEVNATVDVYKSDFGTLKFTDSVFIRQRSALIINPEMIKIAYLRRMQTYEIARIGDSKHKQMITECTLQMANERAHGIIADLL